MWQCQRNDINKGEVNMSIFSQFETDRTAEVEGVWVDYGENSDGTIPSFKVSRMSKANKKYTKALDRATRPHRRAIELETLKEETAESLFLNVFVETVLLDWKNIQDRSGNEIPFSKEKALEIMNALPELYDDLQDKAKKAMLFRQEVLEEEAGN
jgi:hypothetical protein